MSNLEEIATYISCYIKIKEKLFHMLIQKDAQTIRLGKVNENGKL